MNAFNKLSNEELRDVLIELGEDVGPINTHLRHLFLKRIETLRKRSANVSSSPVFYASDSEVKTKKLKRRKTRNLSVDRLDSRNISINDSSFSSSQIIPGQTPNSSRVLAGSTTKRSRRNLNTKMSNQRKICKNSKENQSRIPELKHRKQKVEYKSVERFYEADSEWYPSPKTDLSGKTTVKKSNKRRKCISLVWFFCQIIVFGIVAAMMWTVEHQRALEHASDQNKAEDFLQK